MSKLFRISELESQLQAKTSTEGKLQQQRQVNAIDAPGPDFVSLLTTSCISLQEHEEKIEELKESLTKLEAALKQAHDKVEVGVKVAQCSSELHPWRKSSPFLVG